MDVLPRPVQLDLALGEATHAGAHGGGVLGPHAGVGDDHRVGGEPVGVAFDEVAEVRGAGLLLALDQELEVHGRCAAPGGGEVGADAECVEEHLTLVVGGTARVEAVSVDHRFEGVGVPAVLAGCGLHVVVSVDEDRGAPGSSAGHSAKTAGRPR